MNHIKTFIKFIKNYELEANLSCLLAGIVAGRYPLLVLRALAIVVLGVSLILIVVLAFVGREDFEPNEPGYIKAISKGKK